MYELVIAEKPSVAQSIAKVLGCTEKKDGYLAGDSHLVSWCVGHLVEPAEPEDYDGKYENLHYLPEAYKYSHALYPLPVLYRKQFCFIYSNILSRTPRLAWDFYESNNHAHSRLCAQYYLKNCTTFIQ